MPAGNATDGVETRGVRELKLQEASTLCLAQKYPAIMTKAAVP